MNAATTSRFQSWTSAASRQRSARRRSMSSSRRSIRVGRFGMSKSVGPPSDDKAARAKPESRPLRCPLTSRPSFSVGCMGQIRFGPARVLSRESPDEAIELLRERGYTANEIDFESGFWMDYPWAEEFGKLARKRKIAL